MGRRSTHRMLGALVILLIGHAGWGIAAGGCGGSCEWGYGPADGPPRWGTLCCPVCDGASQSPIDIVPASVGEATTGELQITYGESHLEFSNTGRTLEAASRLSPETNVLEVDGRRYVLSQFHFHSLSEHTVDGRHSPMELHFVHRRASYDLAVVAVLVEEGAEHADLAPLWNGLPADPTVPPRTVILDPRRLLPAGRSYYTYRGSLTTPDCAEVVRWFVLTDPIELSMEQIEAFRAIFDDNYRPVQPLNGRAVEVRR